MIVTDASRVGPWVCEQTGGTWKPGWATAIGLERNGQIVAGAMYEDWNGANVMAHIAITGAISREFLRVIFDYPFNQMGAKRITGIVPSSNHKALRFDQHLGFELEATLKDAHPDGDLLILSITPDRCRWLKGKNELRKSKSATGP